MTMNSFSLRLQQQRELEEGLSGVLDQYKRGEEFTSSAFRILKEINFEPVDLKKLKIQWPEDPGAGRRTSPRFNASMTVLIFNHKKAFRSQTENISLSGLLLTDTLPEEFSKNYFDVVIIQETEAGRKNYLLFRGRAIQGRLRTPRVVFESLAHDSQQKLSKLCKNLEPVT